MTTIQNIISLVTELAPQKYAYDWDNVGLQMGKFNQKVKRVLLTLDINGKVLAEALEKNCELIISHHPLIFKGINSIHDQTETGRILLKAAKNNISIFSAHTNMDVAPGGLNDYLAKLLNIEVLNVLEANDEIKGNQISKKEKVIGVGRIGNLDKKIILKEYLELIKKKLNIKHLKYHGDKNKIIKKIAVCNGSGADFIKNAHYSGADLYITSDVKYHEAQLAEEFNLALVDAGHYETEIIFRDLIYSYLKEKAEKKKFDINLYKSTINTNPWNYL